MKVTAVKKIVEELSKPAYKGTCFEIGTKCDRRFSIELLSDNIKMEVDTDNEVLEITGDTDFGTCWIDTNEIAYFDI